ncbi:MAG TPA: hypothetical protein VEC16_00385 [Alphaproteobacteria bacterium]|nr:hypothetical protein [Alphaproteobacteria bacterium]
MEQYEKSDIKGNYKLNVTANQGAEKTSHLVEFTIPNNLPIINYNENADRKALGLDTYKRMTMLQDIKKEDLESRVNKDKN